MERCSGIGNGSDSIANHITTLPEEATPLLPPTNFTISMKLEEARKLRELRAVNTEQFLEEFRLLTTKENGRQMSQAEKVVLIEKRKAESRLPRISDLENRINALPLRAINLDKSPWRRNSDVDGVPWWRNAQKMLTLFLAVVVAIIILILIILFSVEILPGKASNTTTISTSHIL